MKDGIHPEYNVVAVACACGNKFEDALHQAELQVDVCAACHPFYTGKQRMMDTQGRVDRFRRRYAGATGAAGLAGAAQAAAAAASESK